MNMMLLVVFFVGLVVGTIISLMMRRNDGSSNNSGSNDTSILDDFGECDGVDYHFYKYEEGTKEYKSSVLLLTHDLYVIRTITGLCHTEKDVLDCAIRYIEGKEGI